MTRVAFYDPYLEVLGGGEKYLLTILEDVASSPSRPDVIVMSPTRPDPARWRRLNIFVDPRQIRWRRANHLSASALSLDADLFVALTNHFPPLSLARRSVALVQFPFARLRAGHGLASSLRAAERSLRVRSYDMVVCYSRFVARAVSDRLGVSNSLVLPPPVDIPSPPPAGAKEAKVLVVGRFFPAAHENNKKHEVLIEAWRQLEQLPEARGWELHLAGGVHADAASEAHLDRLRRLADGLSVHFHPNAELDRLRDLYRRSALFWHAAGYGESRPERLEHFGITTVEAMAHRCVPIVVALGGQLEIVEDRRNGRLWSTTDQLVAITAELMSDRAGAERLGAEAAASSVRFSKERFLDVVRASITGPAGLIA
jgi:glycosyltransferase involved in cell wall biosynthesis